MQIDSILYGYKLSARFINFPSISMIRTMAEAQAKDKLCRVIDQVAKSIIKENGFQAEIKKTLFAFLKGHSIHFYPISVREILKHRFLTQKSCHETL